MEMDKGFLVEVVVSSFDGIVHKRVESIDLKCFKKEENAKIYATVVSETMHIFKTHPKVKKIEEEERLEQRRS